MHRSAGKTIICLNELIKAAITCEDTSGVPFVYVCPEKAQAKRVAWNPLKYYLEGIDCKIREDELSIQFAHNNAIIRLEGVSDSSSLRGIHVGMLVVDEIGDMKPEDWRGVLFPTVHARNAKVIMIGTVSGENLLTELFDQAKTAESNGDRNWKAIDIDVYSSGVYTKDYIDTVIRRGTTEAYFEREYLNKRNAKITGTFYGDCVDQVAQVGDYAWNPSLPVLVGIDLGTVDYMAMWFAQQVGKEIHLIDYHDITGKRSDYLISYLKSKPYYYDKLILPHDAVKTNHNDARTVEKVLRKAGFTVKVLSKTANRLNDIRLVRDQLYLCRWDASSAMGGFTKLMQYKSKIDKFTGNPTGEPERESTGIVDCADAFRYLILGIKELGMYDMAARGMLGQAYRYLRPPTKSKIRKI